MFRNCPSKTYSADNIDVKQTTFRRVEDNDLNVL